MLASAATASGEASGPMSIWAALPGRISSTRNTTMDAPISVARRVINRLRKNRPMGEVGEERGRARGRQN
ncbi:hypothetical protein D3C72_2270890 [compost metagenome]